MKRDCPKHDPKSKDPKPQDSSALSIVGLVVANPNPTSMPTLLKDALFKFYGEVKSQQIIILLNASSVHDIVSPSLVDKVHLATYLVPPIFVSSFAPRMES